MKKRLIIVLFLSLIYSLFAQNPPDTLWTKTYGGNEDEVARSIQLTNDEGYIVTGNIGLFYTSDILLFKTDQDGNIIWEHTFDNQFQDRANSVIQTLDGGFIIAGSTFLDSPNFYDAWLIKTDQNGNVIWDSTYGGEDSEVATSIIQLNDGSFIIAGNTTSYGSGCFDMWLFKIDQEGNLEWQHTFGGEANEGAMSLQQTLDGGFIIAGWTELPGSDIDVLLVKTDQNGLLMWESTFNITDEERANSVLQTDDGGYIIAGYSETTSTSNADALLIKVDQGGDLEWYNTYGGSEDEMAFSVLQTDDSEYIIAGFTESFGAGSDDVWIIKTDQDGNLIWDITLGGSEEDLAYSIQQTNDDGFILAGYTESFGAGNKDAYLIRLSSEVGVNDHILPNVINQHYLYSNYPNPFNPAIAGAGHSPATTISFSIPEESKVEVTIYNIKGQKVKTITDDHFEKGIHSVTWNGEDKFGNPISSGVYLYKLDVNGKTEAVKKCILLE
ncbi:MAG: T9SS type A sorting domain-containing protein [Candidatus Cloacimonetes bacterium]|nr:T9SS type A sorting domain-containing protein [Candidatus Cloacimonadota bacterium]